MNDLEKLLLNCCDPIAIHCCENCRHAGECSTCTCIERYTDIKMIVRKKTNYMAFVHISRWLDA